MFVFLRNTLLLIFLAILVIGFVYYYIIPKYFPGAPKETEDGFREINIKGETFKLEVVDTEEKRKLGLGGREAIPADRGMLFLFDHPNTYGMWMKGMLFPLDIIWLKNKEVVDIIEDLEAPKEVGVEPQTYYPQVDSDAVVELNAGTVNRLNIKIGDKINF